MAAKRQPKNTWLLILSGIIALAITGGTVTLNEFGAPINGVIRIAALFGYLGIFLTSLASNYARLTPQFESRPCDVSAVARQVVAQARAAGGVQLRLETSNQRAIVMGDAVALRRILENLVDNALDSLGSQPGTVSVSTQVVATESSRPSVRVVVSDTGCGLSAEQVARAFDDFYTTKEGGTGLGLSIVRRLVMDLNGSVKVE